MLCGAVRCCVVPGRCRPGPRLPGRKGRGAERRLEQRGRARGKERCRRRRRRRCVVRRGDSDSDNTRAESPAAGGKGTASLWSDSGRSSASVLKVLVRCRRCGQDVRAFVTVASTPSDQAQGQACPADRLELELELKSNQTRRGAAVQTLLLCMLCCLYCFALLHAAHCHCCVSLPCYSLQPTALPSVEITKLDSHLRYCTLTATPPAFHHSAQAATPMPVASLRLLTRLDSAATAALPGMLSDTSRRVALTRCVREQVCKAGFSPASHVRSAGCIPP